MREQDRIFFFPSGVGRGAQSWAGAMGCKEAPADWGWGWGVCTDSSGKTHSLLLSPATGLYRVSNHSLLCPLDPGWSESRVFGFGGLQEVVRRANL